MEEKFDSYPQAWPMDTLMATKKEVSTAMPMPKVFIGKVLMFWIKKKVYENGQSDVRIRIE